MCIKNIHSAYLYLYLFFIIFPTTSPASLMVESHTAFHSQAKVNIQMQVVQKTGDNTTMFVLTLAMHHPSPGCCLRQGGFPLEQQPALKPSCMVTACMENHASMGHEFISRLCLLYLSHHPHPCSSVLSAHSNIYFQPWFLAGHRPQCSDPSGSCWFASLLMCLLSF